MRIFFGAITVLTVSLSACNSANPKFCTCMEAGEKLDAKTTEILNGQNSMENKKELVKIRKEQKEACADFVNVDGPTLRKWQEECAAN